MCPTGETRKNPRNCWAWHTLAKRVLREEIVCRMCRAVGRTKKAEEADHIIPLRKRPDLLLSRRNIQAWCRECHLRKTKRERLQIVSPPRRASRRVKSKTFARRRKRKQARRYLEIDINGDIAT